MASSFEFNNEEDEEPELVPIINNPLPASTKDTDPIKPKVPITLLTGFLGSGKTTLLNYILTTEHQKKVAVILNEFGESNGIEKHALSNTQDGVLFEDWLELQNGCLCCSVKDSGVKAIENLLTRKDSVKFDYILLETTGLADPGPIASMFWLDDALESLIGLDGVVTVIDAKYSIKMLNEAKQKGEINEVIKQIACADRIIINKMDLVTPEETQALEELVISINPSAPMVKTERSRVNLDFILDLKIYDKSCLPQNFNTTTSHSNSFNQLVNTVTLPLFNINSSHIKKLEKWIQLLLWEHQVPHTLDRRAEPSTEMLSDGNFEVLRLKGIVYLSPNDSTESSILMIQGVQETYEIIPLESNLTEPESSPTSRLVLIGCQLPAEALQSSINLVFQ